MEIVGVFGTYVRQEQRPDSDLDLLIELDRPPKISLIGLVEIEDYLSQILGVKVDLAIKTNLKKTHRQAHLTGSDPSMSREFLDFVEDMLDGTSKAEILLDGVSYSNQAQNRTDIDRLRR